MTGERGECRIVKFSDLRIGLEETIVFSINDEDMEAFAKVSGDRNPLHTDAEFARSKGYRDRVVYGALLIAKVSQLIGMNLPGRDAILTGVRASFPTAVCIGDTVVLTARVLHISDATNAVDMQIRASVDGRVAMTGKAETLLRA